MYFEAIKYEKERNGGFLSPFGYSTTTAAAAINTVSSMEVLLLRIHSVIVKLCGKSSNCFPFFFLLEKIKVRFFF